MCKSPCKPLSSRKHQDSGLRLKGKTGEWPGDWRRVVQQRDQPRQSQGCGFQGTGLGSSYPNTVGYEAVGGPQSLCLNI